MKTLRILLSLLCVLCVLCGNSSCATKVRDANGVVRLETTADSSFSYRGSDGSTLTGTFIHSTPTIAAGNAVATVADSLGRAVVGGIIASAGGASASVLPKLAGGAAAALPTVKSAVSPPSAAQLRASR